MSFVRIFSSAIAVFLNNVFMRRRRWSNSNILRRTSKFLIERINFDMQWFHNTQQKEHFTKLRLTVSLFDFMSKQNFMFRARVIIWILSSGYISLFTTKSYYFLKRHSVKNILNFYRSNSTHLLLSAMWGFVKYVGIVLLLLVTKVFCRKNYCNLPSPKLYVNRFLRLLIFEATVLLSFCFMRENKRI